MLSGISKKETRSGYDTNTTWRVCCRCKISSLSDIAALGPRDGVLQNRSYQQRLQPNSDSVPNCVGDRFQIMRHTKKWWDYVSY
jgi:hypothetical protein